MIELFVMCGTVYIGFFLLNLACCIIYAVFTDKGGESHKNFPSEYILAPPVEPKAKPMDYTWAGIIAILFGFFLGLWFVAELAKIESY